MSATAHAGERGGLLTLDLSSVVGWAYGVLTARDPIFGAVRLPRIGGLGAKFAHFENFLIDTLEMHAPSHVFMEAPLPLPAMNNVEAAHQQLGLAAYVRGECYRYSVPVSSQDAYSVRVEVLGTGRFEKGKTKDAVMAWCRRRGWMVPDDHAGDACVLWEFYRRRVAS